MPDMSIKTRLQHAFNAFRNRDPTEPTGYYTYGSSSSSRPDRVIVRPTTERSIIMSVYNQIAMDVCAQAIHHIKVDQDEKYIETVNSGLEYALNVEANIDQTGKALIKDLVVSMFDEGCVAVIPTDTTINPRVSGSYDIITMRTGKILEWYPQHIRVRVYNEQTGYKEDLLWPKKTAAIIENPFYLVMNEPNSTLKRLIRKLNILDAIDEQSGAGKLDIIIQVPYTIKTDARRELAEKRRKDIEVQLADSKYGVAYTDGSEKIVQLNRPAENNLMTQIQYLTSMLYSQLGSTEDVFNGKADETALLNYRNRTVNQILTAIIEEFKRKFLTRTARTQGHSLKSFRDAFANVTADKMADIGDKYTRNEILTSNEVRDAIGYKPSKAPGADDLRNKNLNAPPPGQNPQGTPPPDQNPPKGDNNNGQV